MLQKIRFMELQKIHVYSQNMTNLESISSSINQLFSEVFSDIYELISDGRFGKPKPLEVR